MYPTRRDFLLGVLASGLAAGCGGDAFSLPTGGAPGEESAFDAATRARLDDTLDQALAALPVPGAIVGVWVGARAWTALRGVADEAARTPVNGALHTRIGSVTKTMVGTLVLQLVQQGRLGLDDSLERWFPQLPDADRITIRMLGTMASGISSYSLDPVVVSQYLASPTRTWTPEELVAAGTGLPRTFAPGAGFQYSNTNFVMLGLIVESLCGQPLADVLSQRLFAPLGMTESSYPLDTALPSPYWSGYTPQGAEAGQLLDSTHWSPTFASAAGEVVSTLEDLRRWTRALGTGSLLVPALQAERLEPNPYSEGGGRAYLFALGREAGGWLAHDGQIPGYNTQVAYLPARDASIVVMVNTDAPGPGGQAPAAAIFHALAEVVAG